MKIVGVADEDLCTPETGAAYVVYEVPAGWEPPADWRRIESLWAPYPDDPEELADRNGMVALD